MVLHFCGLKSYPFEKYHYYRARDIKVQTYSSYLPDMLWSHDMFLEGVYEIELDTKTEYGGFWGTLPHSKIGILKPVFKDTPYCLYSLILH